MPLPFAPEVAEQLFSHDTWSSRRRWLRIGALGLSLNAQALLIYAMWRATLDPALVEIFLSLLGAVLSIFFAYVFGAIWDDNNKRGHIAKLASTTDGDGGDRPHLSKDPKPAGGDQ